MQVSQWMKSVNDHLSAERIGVGQLFIFEIEKFSTFSIANQTIKSSVRSFNEIMHCCYSVQ